MVSTIGYIRVSPRGKKKAHVETEARQRAIILGWGHPVDRWYADHDVSGAAAIKDRPQLLIAVGMLEPGDTLVVAGWSRLARDRIAAALLRRHIQERGAEVVAADGIANDSDSPEGRLIQGILDLFFEYERELIVARTRAAMAARRELGLPTSHAPYGKTKTGGRLVDNIEEQKTIARITKLRSEGRAYRDIAAVLRVEGFRNRKNGCFDYSRVRRIWLSSQEKKR